MSRIQSVSIQGGGRGGGTGAACGAFTPSHSREGTQPPTPFWSALPILLPAVIFTLYSSTDDHYHLPLESVRLWWVLTALADQQCPGTRPLVLKEVDM